jgi:hypothetical protein
VSVRLVLDTSALLAYLRLEGVAVGELIGTVEENGDVTGVPGLAVLDVWPDLADDERARLEDLVRAQDGPVVVLPVPADSLLEVARVAALVKVGQGVAHAVVEAGRHAATLATTRPDDVTGVMEPDDVLELS